ncbi:hypothetical protein P4S72_16115 [Vibrio sp. PP-XX7]
MTVSRSHVQNYLPSPGQPHLAETVATMLEDAGWAVKRDGSALVMIKGLSA